MGKTYLVQTVGTDYLDCNTIAAQLASSEAIDTGIEYLRLRWTQAKRLRPTVLVLDNIHAICPLVSSDEQFNIIESLKSLKFTQLISSIIEKHSDGIRVIGVARHFMGVNTRLLDVGTFDRLVEMQAPAKETRYSLLRDNIVPQELRGKELYL